MNILIILAAIKVEAAEINKKVKKSSKSCTNLANRIQE